MVARRSAVIPVTIALALVVVRSLPASFSKGVARQGDGAKNGLRWEEPLHDIPDVRPLPRAARARLGRVGYPFFARSLSRDGRFLATPAPSFGKAGDPHYPISLWDARAGKFLRLLDGHTGIVLTLVFWWCLTDVARPGGITTLSESIYDP